MTEQNKYRNMPSKSIKIDIVSDVACPWCYVGKRRVEAAIEQWEGDPIEVTWHPYQLDPTIPEEGMTRKAYLENKFGSIERIQPMLDNLERAGEELGIDFNFGKPSMAVNTLPLHQLLYVAGQEGFQDELKEQFLKAYFVDKRPLNDIAVISSIMADFGWDKEKVEKTIADDSIAKSVKEEIAFYQQRGVSGVPFFVINDKYGISGAQPVETFLSAFSSVAPIQNEQEGTSCDHTQGEC